MRLMTPILPQPASEDDAREMRAQRRLLDRVDRVGGEGLDQHAPRLVGADAAGSR